MGIENEAVEKPSLQKLKEAIIAYLRTHELGAAILASATILRTDENQKINSLSGTCTAQANELNEFLDSRGIPTDIVKSKKDCVHTFIKCQTTDDEIIIDPTLGQFVTYPGIFVGTLTELRQTFLSPERELLTGTRLWAVEHEITSREEWFQILYET